MRKAVRLSSASTPTVPSKDSSLTDPRSPLTVWWSDRWWKDRGKRTEEIRFSYHVYLPWQSASDRMDTWNDGKKCFRGRVDEKDASGTEEECACQPRVFSWGRVTQSQRDLKQTPGKGAYVVPTPTQGFEKCIFEFQLDLVKMWVVLVWSLCYEWLAGRCYPVAKVFWLCFNTFKWFTGKLNGSSLKETYYAPFYNI